MNPRQALGGGEASVPKILGAYRKLLSEGFAHPALILGDFCQILLLNRRSSNLSILNRGIKSGKMI